jgi:RHS repeat-associated protein
LPIPRREPAYSEQGETYVTYTENWVTNKPNKEDWYRIGLPVETRTYEITGIDTLDASPRGPYSWTFIQGQLKDIEDRLQDSEADSQSEINYEAFAEEGALQRRLIEQARTYYRSNAQADSLNPDRLPRREVESLALPCESFKRAFTETLLGHIYGEKLTETEKLETLLVDEGCYVRLDSLWWIPSGRQAFVPERFYLPDRMQDPFGEVYRFTYDEYSLLVTETRDPLDNRVTIGERDREGSVRRWGNNYRVMQPWLITDPNGNRAQVAFDTLGLVAGTAVMGKVDESDEGDLLDNVISDLTQDQINDFFADPLGTAVERLGTATTRIIYDLERFQQTQREHPNDPTQWQPAWAATLARETHVSDLEGDATSKVQVSFLYSDGFGRELQTKIQAEPGLAPKRGEDGVLKCNENLVYTDPRWVGTGRTIYNNKGKPVKQYEPFFSPTHGYESERGLVECGVTPILFYDPLGRVVATLHPNKTYEKVVFDPWQQTTWDVNDTVAYTEISEETHKLICDPEKTPADDLDVGHFFAALPQEEYLEVHDVPDEDPEYLTWYQARMAEKHGNAERDAAKKAAVHAGTPSVAHLDTLGRPFLTIVHNKFEQRTRNNGEDQLVEIEQKYETRVEQDIEGQSLTITDARNNPVMVNTLVSEGQRIRTYDLLGNGLYSHSSDAGERWMLNDVAGNPIRGWDSRGHTLRYIYDRLQRPVGLYVQGGDHPNEILAECTVYGEGVPEAAQRNLRGQVYQVFDAAGVVTSEGYDFKGNLLRGHRRLAKEYKQRMDWDQENLWLAALIEAEIPSITAIEEAIKPYLERPPQYKGESEDDNPENGEEELAPEPERFTTETTYDALNRPVKVTTPDNSVTRPIYNEANLLNGLTVGVRGAAATTLVTNIDYNAKGQRTRIDYGNGVWTEYTYDQQTYRLTRLLTKRPPQVRPDSSIWKTRLQDLHYTYDPVGNITCIHDDAQQEIFFKNQVVRACSEYTYDALYRLITATGREHLGQQGDGCQKPIPISSNESITVNHRYLRGDGQAMGRYRQQYVYDEVGNILKMIHQRSNSENPGWRRCYQYALESNRLLSTGYQSDPFVACDPDRHYAAEALYQKKYRYDLHGNMNQMPHLPIMQWDFKDQLQASATQVVTGSTPEKTYYVYDAAGQRVRKVTERAAPEGINPTRMKERIYLGGLEIYRDYNGGGETVKLERETLHVMDDQQRIALVETKTLEVKKVEGDNSPTDLNVPLIRYQLNNHLGSSCVEVDGAGEVISHEEYHPYGTTAYYAVSSEIEVSLKRYRHTGKERDQESGLYYYGARYCSDWLGRWINSDPIGLKGGINSYSYTQNNPITKTDFSGTQEQEPEMLHGLGMTIDSEGIRLGGLSQKSEFDPQISWQPEIVHVEKSVQMGGIGQDEPTYPLNGGLSDLDSEKQNRTESADSEETFQDCIEVKFLSPKLGKAAIRITNPTVDLKPSKNGFIPKDPNSKLTAAEHVLNEHGASGKGSPWISTSTKRGGASNIEGSRRYFIDITEAQKGGSEFLGGKELAERVDLDVANEKPHLRYRIENMWKKNQPNVEGEGLFRGKIHPRAVETPTVRGLKGLGRGLMLVGVALTLRDLNEAREESQRIGSPAPFMAETIRQASAWTFAIVLGMIARILISLTGYGALIVFSVTLIASLIGGMLGYYIGDLPADKIYRNELYSN